MSAGTPFKDEQASADTAGPTADHGPDTRDTISCVVFPSLKAKQLLKVLGRKPLSYSVSKQVGSHRKLESAEGYPMINYAFHSKDEVPPGLVRRILVQQVGLSEQEALELIK